MTKVIKKVETFKKPKLIASIRKAGLSPKAAKKLGAEISKKIIKRAKIKSTEIRKLVLKALNKVSKKAAKKFRKYKKKK